MLSTTLFTENWLQRLGITSIAFIGALAGVVITVILARGFQHTFRLLLAGVIVGVILAAISSFFAIMHPEILPAMQAFMLGTTSFAGWSACLLMSVVLITCCLVAWTLSKALDALTLGELTAISLGLRLNFARGILIVVLALATGAAVSQVGLIAFVGLAAPHLVRSLIKVVHRTLLIYSTLIGGILLLGADILARALIAPQELPVGLLTAILGGSYLLWLMHAGQNRAK
jgi:iron complex transport system permease protein